VTDHQIRATILDALAYASVFAVRDTGVSDAFLAGTRDITFTDLQMDSLATMELCIALEVNAGISIVPDELQTIGSLQRLVDAVRSRTR
jgi:acyl carrier protein